MPSALKYLVKKGRPRLGKKKNKVWSKAKRRGNRHVDRKMLDNMMSPVVSWSFKHYGTNNVFDDSAATSTELPNSGNLSSAQGQPGRQLYFEFIGLPLRNFNQTFPTLDPSVGSSTFIRPMAFLDLLYGAFKRNRYFNQQSGQVADPSNFGYSTADFTFNLPTLHTTNASTNNQVMDSTHTVADFVENVLSNSAFNFKYCYLGGHQTHKFQNTTTLPIHGEIIEFSPRQVMGHDIKRRNLPLLNTLAATPTDIQCYPGMWQTLYADLLRTHNREQGAAEAGGAYINWMQPGLYNELDDRNFKYNSRCEETNFRWVVGKPVKFTIYPGEVFEYKMVFPPMSGDSFQFAKNIQRYWSNITGSYKEVEWGVAPCYMPGFTKFCQIRMIGSRAYTAPVRTDNAALDPNMMVDGDNDVYPGVTTTNPGQNANRPIMHSATHGVRVTHTVTEHHSMRTFPTFDGRVHNFKDFTANAENTGDIGTAAAMRFIDVLDNAEEGYPGDN